MRGAIACACHCRMPSTRFASYLASDGESARGVAGPFTMRLAGAFFFFAAMCHFAP